MRATTATAALEAPERVTHLTVSPDWDTPWRAVVQALPALRTLNLDGCGADEADIDALAGHPTLERLTLGSGRLSELRGLRALPALRELDLRGCRRVTDLAPLAGLPLRWLGLDGCARVRDLGPLLDLPELRGVSLEACDGAPLGPVMTHPTLEEITGDAEKLAQWARRGELEGIRPERIRDELGAAEPARRIAALQNLVTWVELTSARDANAVYEVLGLDERAKDTEHPVPAPLLAEALATEGVEASLAARVFGACFRSVRDDLEPALRAAEIVCRRGAPADERVLVDAFLFARRFYDPGHRRREGDVHDALIERVFPRLTGEALTYLLAQLDDAALALDELEALFPRAFGRAGAKELDVLDARLRRYLAACAEQRSLDERRALLTAIVEERGEVRDRLADVLPDDLEVSWQSRLLAALGEPTQAREVVGAVVAAVDSGALSLEELQELGPWFDEAIKVAGALPVDVAQRVVELAIPADWESWLQPAVLRPLVRERLAWLDALGSPTRERVIKWLRFWQRDEPDPDGVGLTAALARLTGVSVEEQSREAVVSAIERGLNHHRKDLGGALARFAAQPFPLEWKRSWTKSLASRLDGLRVQGRPDEIVRLMATMRDLRPHLTWAPKDQQYALSYLLPIAVERGPEFFAEHIAPWLEGVEIEDARLAYNLACYQAARGDTAALCDAIRRALALGKTPSQFLEDADFASRLDEPEVRALLGTPRSLPRYFAMKRVSYGAAPCRFLDMGYKPGRPSWWEHDWQGGEPLDPKPEGPLRFDLKPYQEEHPEMGRALPLLHLGTIPLMRAPLVQALEEGGARLEKFPAVLVDPDDGSEHGGYFAVNVLGTLAPEALGRFHGRLTDAAHGAGGGFEDVQGSEAPLDGLVLAWIEDTYTLVVYEPLRDALVAAGFDELTFKDLSQIAM